MSSTSLKTSSSRAETEANSTQGHLGSDLVDPTSSLEDWSYRIPEPPSGFKDQEFPPSLYSGESSRESPIQAETKPTLLPQQFSDPTADDREQLLRLEEEAETTASKDSFKDSGTELSSRSPVDVKQDSNCGVRAAAAESSSEEEELAYGAEEEEEEDMVVPDRYTGASSHHQPKSLPPQHFLSAAASAGSTGSSERSSPITPVIRGPMQFSIDSYDSRDKKEVPYRKKLVRSESMNSNVVAGNETPGGATTSSGGSSGRSSSNGGESEIMSTTSTPVPAASPVENPHHQGNSNRSGSRYKTLPGRIDTVSAINPVIVEESYADVKKSLKEVPVHNNSVLVSKDDLSVVNKNYSKSEERLTQLDLLVSIDAAGVTNKQQPKVATPTDNNNQGRKISSATTTTTTASTTTVIEKKPQQLRDPSPEINPSQLKGVTSGLGIVQHRPAAPANPGMRKASKTGGVGVTSSPSHGLVDANFSSFSVETHERSLGPERSISVETHEGSFMGSERNVHEETIAFERRVTHNSAPMTNMAVQTSVGASVTSWKSNVRKTSLQANRVMPNDDLVQNNRRKKSFGSTAQAVNKVTSMRSTTMTSGNSKSTGSLDKTGLIEIVALREVPGMRRGDSFSPLIFLSMHGREERRSNKISAATMNFFEAAALKVLGIKKKKCFSYTNGNNEFNQSCEVSKVEENLKSI